MPKTDPSKPLCKRCGVRNAQITYKGYCHRCYEEMKVVPKTPLDALGTAMTSAQTEDDWKRLASELGPTVASIAKGEIKATAAQAAMLKEILGRAHGRISKSQEDSQGPIGIVVLPTLGIGPAMHLCPKCIDYHTTHG